jgi:hypothetical protein
MGEFCPKLARGYGFNLELEANSYIVRPPSNSPIILSLPNSPTRACREDPLPAEFNDFVFECRRRLKRTKAIAVATRIIPAPAPTPIPAAAPELMPDVDDEGDGVVVIVIKAVVAVADGVEYVAVPVVGRTMIVVSLDGAGAGKISSVATEQSGSPPL